ncbi:MAG TPA: sigma-70 family RNA polymerase sigma factor [Solirubrobacteraceae bacterium]|nr:sigma-70 family RNA polymerase sigma factor [Solirubrobacteraceae bacterium]
MSAGTQAPAGAGNDEFVDLTEPYRRELFAHCYRMLGSIDDAEELVQETYLRAWRSFQTFEGRASVRAWMYRIATNVCLTALARPARRVLPSGLGAPSGDPDSDPVMAGAGVAWLEPVPDSLSRPDTTDPAEIAAARASVRLALIASLQHLPPRQRAVLILRDVLGFAAAEVAQMLDASTAAVKSALQRARARLEEASPSLEELTEPDSRGARELLGRYMHAFEHSDLAALEQVLVADAALEMTPAHTWFAGKRNCVGYIRRVIGPAGTWVMAPAVANGQPAALAYRRSDTGDYEPFAVVVLTVTDRGIARITLFSDGSLFSRFDLPESLVD